MSAENRSLLKKLIKEVLARDVEVRNDDPVEVDGRWYSIYKNTEALAVYVKAHDFPTTLTNIDWEKAKGIKSTRQNEFLGWLPVDSMERLNEILSKCTPVKPA